MRRIIDVFTLFTLMGSFVKLGSYFGLNLHSFFIFICASFYISPFAKSIKILRQLKIRKVHLWVMLPLALTVLSLIWTSNVKMSFIACIEVGLVVYFAFAFGQQLEFREFCLRLYIAIAIATFFSLIIIVFIPAFGLHNSGPDQGVAWAGLFEHKNTLGRTVGFGVVLGLYIVTLLDNKRCKKLYFFVLNMVLLYVCVKAKSGAVLLALVTLILFYYFFSKRVLLRKKIYYLILLLPFLPLFMIILTSALDFILLMLGRDPGQNTFGVREHLWATVLNDSMDNFFLGWGPGAYWGAGGKTLSVFSQSNLVWTTHQAHNGLIEFYLSYGLLGVLTFFAMFYKLIDTFGHLVKLDINYYYASIGIVIYILIINNAYSVLIGQVVLPWFILSTLFIMASKVIKK